jgi:uncharacterized protein YgiM (DUF1202 family)
VSAQTIGIITAEQLNVRNCPSTECGVIGTTFKGATFIILNKVDSWYLVQDANGNRGFVHEDWVELQPSNAIPQYSVPQMDDPLLAEWKAIKNLIDRQTADLVSPTETFQRQVPQPIFRQRSISAEQCQFLMTKYEKNYNDCIESQNRMTTGVASIQMAATCREMLTLVQNLSRQCQ